MRLGRGSTQKTFLGEDKRLEAHGEGRCVLTHAGFADPFEMVLFFTRLLNSLMVITLREHLTGTKQLLQK